MAAPDVWVGQLVTVFVNGVEGSLLAELVEVNDRGIVVRLPEDPREARPQPEGSTWVPQLSFHPWSTLNMVQVTESDIITERPENPAP
jgi:hypothetical protein